MKLIRFTLLSAAALALVSCGPKQEEVQGETVHLLLCQDIIGTRTGRISPHVYHVGPFRHQLRHPLAYILTGLLPAIGIERVGRKVEDAHHLRRVKHHQPPVHIDCIGFERYHITLFRKLFGKCTHISWDKATLCLFFIVFVVSLCYKKGKQT